MLPPHIHLRHLAHPTDAHIDQLTELLMRAFQPERTVHALLGAREPEGTLYRLFMKTQVLGMAHSAEVWVAEDLDLPAGEGRIVGCAGWYGPGREFMGDQAQRERAGLEGFMRSLPDEVRNWWLSYYLPRVHQFTETFLGLHTIKANYLLHCLAVLPSYQNLHIGRALLLSRGQQAMREEGKRVFWYAVGEGRVVMYERWGGVVWGGEVFESVRVSGGTADGTHGKEVWGMWVLELVDTKE